MAVAKFTLKVPSIDYKKTIELKVNCNECIKTLEYDKAKVVMWVNEDFEAQKNKFLRGQKIIRLSCVNKKNEVKIVFWKKDLGYQFDFLPQNLLSKSPLRDDTNIKQNLINELEHVIERNKYEIECTQFKKGIEEIKNSKDELYLKHRDQLIAGKVILIKERLSTYSEFIELYNQLNEFKIWVSNSTDIEVKKCINDFESYFKRDNDRFKYISKIQNSLEKHYNPKNIITSTRIVPFNPIDLKKLGIEPSAYLTATEYSPGNTNPFNVYWNATEGFEKKGHESFLGFFPVLIKIKKNLIDLQKKDNRIVKWIEDVLKNKKTIDRFIFIVDYTWDNKIPNRYDRKVGLMSDYSYFLADIVMILIIHEINVNSSWTQFLFPETDSHVNPKKTKLIWQLINKSNKIQFENMKDYDNLYQSSKGISLLIFYLMSTFKK